MALPSAKTLPSSTLEKRPPNRAVLSFVRSRNNEEATARTTETVAIIGKQLEAGTTLI